MPLTTNAVAPAWTIAANAGANSRSLAAFTTTIFRPIARAATSTSGNSATDPGQFGSNRNAMTAALGTSSCSSSNRFATSGRYERYAREVAARPVEAGDEAAFHRIVADHEDDWNGCGGGLGVSARPVERRHLVVASAFYKPLASTTSKTPRRSLPSCFKSMANDGL